MHVPPPYRDDDPRRAERIMDEYPLALLLSQNGALEPHASHVPVVRAVAPHDPAEGMMMVLQGHMNRANPHWAALEPGRRVKFVFSAPGGYVTPSIYPRTAPAAPTWNFLAVHASGSFRPVEDSAGTLAIIEHTVRTLEGRFGAGWDWETSRAYFHRILPAVGAFEVTVDDVAVMVKLSQDQDPGIRERVTEYFESHLLGTARDLGRWMREELPG